MFTAVNKEDRTIKASANAAADDARDGAHRVKEDLRTAANHVKEDLDDLAHQAGRRARVIATQAEESMVSKVRDNPLQSVLIAAGAGFVLGALFRR